MPEQAYHLEVCCSLFIFNVKLIICCALEITAHLSTQWVQAYSNQAVSSNSVKLLQQCECLTHFLRMCEYLFLTLCFASYNSQLGQVLVIITLTSHVQNIAHFVACQKRVTLISLPLLLNRGSWSATWW